MPKYRVTNADGIEVKEGDIVDSFRGDPGIFGGVTRGTEYNGTAKVLVGGCEFYDRAYNLTVTTISA